MLLLAAAIAATAPTNSAPAPPTLAVQATATVRIMSGVRLKLDSPTNSGAPPAHDSKVVTNGSSQPARLIEFQ